MKLITQSHKILNISNDVLQTIEAAGRTCYKSEDKITEGSAEIFVDKLLHFYHHESVLEHASMSVRLITNRGVTHELVRHRLAAYSQESTRYVKLENSMEFIIPVWFDVDITNDLLSDNPCATLDMRHMIWLNSMHDAESAYIKLMKNGWKAQQAREVLPNSLKTEIVVTANLREWRHIFDMRTSKAAHPQIRQLMIDLLNDVKAEIPIIFDDIIIPNN